jgi:cold shock CspA family protein
MIGRCCWWSTDKGYGFIQPIDGSDDVFCHQKSLDDSFGKRGHRNLKRDETLYFETAVREGRLVAVNIRLFEVESLDAPEVGSTNGNI